jgi:hypothetical protein
MIEFNDNLFYGEWNPETNEPHGYGFMVMKNGEKLYNGYVKAGK